MLFRSGRRRGVAPRACAPRNLRARFRGGVAAFDPEDKEIKRTLLRVSGRVAAAVLNEKLETSAPFAVGRAESLDCVVLEADAPESVACAFAERGISVRRAQPASPDEAR